MRGWASLVLVTTLGCGGSKGGPADAPPAVIDASAPDASSIDATLEFDAAPSSGHVLFLNFDGVTLTPAGVDNPSSNKSSLLSKTVAIPAYLANDPDRATKIAAIVAEVEAIVAPYDVTITTTRPAGTQYDMVAAGGTSANAGQGQGLGSETPFNCTSGTPAPTVMFLFEETTDQHSVASELLSMLGSYHGVPLSTQASDCMCYAAASCVTPTAPCTIGGAGTPCDTTTSCNPSVTTMDEQADWLAAFGAHP